MKKYIIGIKLNSNGFYYIRINENSWDEIYNPYFATEFNSIEEALNWGRKETTFGEYIHVLSAKEEIQKYLEWTKNGSVRRTFKFLDKKISKPYNNESPIEILNWHISQQTESVLQEHYNSWPSLFTVFEHIHSLGRTMGGDIMFTIGVKKDANFETFKKELDLILPYNTNCEDSYKVINIVDHFLCEGGNSVDLSYKDENDCKVGGMFTFVVEGTLKKCFDYIRKYRYDD